MEFLLQLIFIILLVFLNGFFVAAEFSLVAVRKTRIDELVKKGNAAAKLVQRALNDLDSFISATQLGITIASLALGWVGEPALAHFIQPLFNFLPKEIASVSAHSISVFIAFAVITFLHIVLGELAPKTIALQKADIVSLIIIAPLTAFSIIFRPFIWGLNQSGSLVLKVFRFKMPSNHQIIYSLQEIKMILAQSSESGTIPKDEVQMLYNVFKLGEIPVKNIMVPRTSIIAFNVAMTLKEVEKRVEDNIHSRFPVYENSIDSIVGFIHIKDIYKKALEVNNHQKNLTQSGIIRKVLSVPETKKADEVLLDMRKKWIHLAIVNDEYGGTAGIVTLEDIIESLVGDIKDEFDEPFDVIKKQSDGVYVLDGRITIDQLQSRFHLLLKGQGYATVGGLVFGILGREPYVGDEVQIGNIILEVKEMDKKRIKKILLKRDMKSRPTNSHGLEK
jgi:putative hemolysin